MAVLGHGMGDCSVERLWLADVLERGRATGTLEFNGSPLDEGRSIMSCLEGAMLVSRSFGEIDRFQRVADHLLTSLRPSVHDR